MPSDIKQFVIDYYTDIDFDYWEKRLNSCVDKVRRLKRDKSKAPYVIDVYSIYLQLLEIFFINALTFSIKEDGFFSILFASSQELRKHIEKQFTNPEYRVWLMNHLIFGLKEKRKINKYPQKYNEYLQILKECTEDYLKDYEFLNSYKHGYRIHINHNVTVGIETFAIVKSGTELTYYTKKRNQIYKNCIVFKPERIFIKCYFILSMLKNCQKVFLNRGKPVELNHYYLLDRGKWGSTYGMFRRKELLFTIEKYSQ